MASQLRAQGRGAIGLGAGDAVIIKAMKKNQPQIIANTASVSQAASLTALDGGQSFQQLSKP